MQRALDQFFKDAVNRKPKRLSFDATRSHGNIYDWLKTILTDWTIIIPGNSCSEYALLSDWPATGFTRNGVKQWLEEGEGELMIELCKYIYICKARLSNPLDLPRSSCENLAGDKAKRRSQIIKNSLYLHSPSPPIVAITRLGVRQRQSFCENNDFGENAAVCACGVH